MRAGVACVAGLLGLGCAGGAGSGNEGARDGVPESRDVVVANGAGSRGAGADQGYEYVARRPLAVVALAEARGVSPDVARAAIDHLADALDTCATEEGRRGTLASGAARVVAQIDGDGRVAGTSVRIDPGASSAGVAQNAVLCLVAPTKLLVFPALNASPDAGVSPAARGMAIEALWGQVGAGRPGGSNAR